MILIRGIKGEQYAKRIEKGIVDCRDVLSSLLQPPVTGYEYSDYYEKNLVKAITYFLQKDADSIHEPKVLYSILIDYYIPHIYLTYFHVLNDRSLEWLEKFDNDYSFIALNIKLDRITKTAIGDGIFGARMSYIDRIDGIAQDGIKGFNIACMLSLEGLFENKLDMNIPLQIYNTLSFPLFYREQDEHYTDIENEFRIFTYDCPIIEEEKCIQIPREVEIYGKTGSRYRGQLIAGENSLFKSDMCILTNPYKSVRDILEDENGRITINSRFKPISICNVSDDYRYIGDKKACADYIQRKLKYKQKELYEDKTVRRSYRIDELHDAIYLPSYQNVEY